MFKPLRLSLLAISLLPVGLSAQNVDRTKYPDFKEPANPDYSLMKSMSKAGAKAVATRPDHVNNAETLHFPPVFNQAGGSCGSASRICYMFSHEMNSFRDLDGKDPHNHYPSHFVWLLTNGNSGKDEFVQFVGVPNAATYGGYTYSKLFGYQECEQNDFGWMQGYDKWYSGMFNRMLKPVNFPVSVQSEEGREAVKNYLWNHNGDTDFHSGGIVGIGVASGGKWFNIPSTPTNDAIGVTNMYYVKEWGTQVDHALTIVGYDDRIEFDLDGDGKYGEEEADEKGAWIIVNSWGDWCNGGFIYCPYAHAVPAFTSDGRPGGGFWTPEVYHVRKNYRPLRTIKIKMDYSRRSEMFLSAGVSSDLDATEPEMTVPFEHFKYAGDGHNGNTRPAPEIPMLGRWADGKLHNEPMEFGYDLTDLSANFDKNVPLKYFFIIQTKNGALGEGKIHEASIIDYEKDLKGIETPFDLENGSGVSIKNDGERTIVSVIVQGHGIYAPQNVSISDGVMYWNAPVKSGYKLTGYKIFKSNDVIATVDAATTSFTLPSDEVTTYGVSAVYEGEESSRSEVSVPFVSKLKTHIDLKNTGFSIPDVFNSSYTNATIEFWINCHSVKNWNQSAGPGWGQFMFHANSDGSLSAGWDTSNRLNAPGAFKLNTWTHVAIVVQRHIVRAYVNGAEKAVFASQSYRGIGGFGDLVFQNGGNNSFDAKIDEIRIWKEARTKSEIQRNRTVEFGDASLPEELVAYYKSDLITIDGKEYLRDHTKGQHHASILGPDYSLATVGSPNVNPSTTLFVKINQPEKPVYANIPATITAKVGSGSTSIKWTAKDAGIENLAINNPNLTFTTAGKHQVIAQVSDKDGKVEADTLELDVLATPAPDASFSLSKPSISAGETISLLPTKPEIGYIYNWSMPGALVEKANTPNASATYPKKGEYEVTLNITGPDGQKASSKQTVYVKQVAPIANFDIHPAVVVKGESVTATDKSKYDPVAWKWEFRSENSMLVGKGRELTFAPEIPGVYNVSLTAINEVGESNAVQEGALIVCNADSKNGLNFSHDNAKLTTQKVPFVQGQKYFTIDWWMNPARLESNGNAIGNQSSDLLITTNNLGQFVFHIGGKVFQSSNNLVKVNSWHHYAITYNRGSVRFYVDGKLIQILDVKVSSLPAMDNFSISNENAPLKGQIDEFRIWNTALSIKQLQSCINQPLEGEELAKAENEMGLQLYYQFNQNGGDVKDLTANNNTGLRTNFGPDGDAWALSKGVFSLCFEKTSVDVTNRYLKNYQAPFKDNGMDIDGKHANSRFLGLALWTCENFAQGPSHLTGAHVDTQKERYMTMTTKWDGFNDIIKDHKVYQTIKLPAGSYEFTANYGDHEGWATGVQLVAAKGKGLPDMNEVATKALAAKFMADKSEAVNSNSIVFTLDEPTEVSVGLLVNIIGQQCLTLKSFNLSELKVVDLGGTQEGIEDVTEQNTLDNEVIYDLQGFRVLNPVKGQVYIIGNKKVLIK